MNKEQAINKLEDCRDFINQFHWELKTIKEHIKGLDDGLNKVSRKLDEIDYYLLSHEVVDLGMQEEEETNGG